MNRQQNDLQDKDLREECISKETIFTGRLVKLERGKVRLPNGVETTREVVRHPGAVAIVALKDHEIIFVKQFRYPIGQITLEIPAGKLDEGEEPIDCAERELREETGYRGTFEYLGPYFSTPGFTDEVLHFFIAKDLVWDPLKPDEDEFLNVESLSWAIAKEKAQKGEFHDLKTMLGILLVAARNRD